MSRQKTPAKPALLEYLAPRRTNISCPGCNAKSVVDVRAPMRRLGFVVCPAFSMCMGVVFALLSADVVPFSPAFVFAFFAIGGSLMFALFFGIVFPLFLPHWTCRQCGKRWKRESELLWIRKAR